MQHPKFASGLAFAFLAVLFWGAQFPIAKDAFAAVDPYHVTAIRYCVATLLLVPIVAATQGPATLRYYGRAWPASVLGVIGMAGSPLLVFAGLGMTRAEHAAIIVSLQPSMTAMADWWLRGRRPARFTIGCIATAFAGVVLVDAPLRRPDPESQEGSRAWAVRSPRVYPTRAEALARFRLLPEQPILHPFLVDHVAGHSVREVPGGWTWKFDPAVFRRPRHPMGERLAQARCRLALIHGEHSAIVPPDVAAYTAEMMGPGAPVVSIPGAHHHLLVDKPLEFVAALRDVLDGWEHAAGPGRS